MHRERVAKRTQRLMLGLLLCVSGFAASASAAAAPPKDKTKDKVTPAYDVFIGFVGRCGCQPLEVHFRQLSIETVFPNLKFKFSPVTYDSETYDWTVASVKGKPSLLMPVPGIGGTGEITDHDLCTYWDKDNHGKLLKATLAYLDPKIQPIIMAVDRAEIRHIKNEILTPILQGPVDKDDLPLEPLAPFPSYVFEFTSNLRSGQSKITLEGSDGELELSDIKFYAEIPAWALLEGKDISSEYAFRHPQVPGPGTVTVRFIPVKKRP